MKICIPAISNKGKDSKLSEHFGSAPYFIIFDTEKNSWEAIENINRHHQHATCNPVELLSDKQIDIVLCSGIGLRALKVLHDAKIKVFEIKSSLTVKEAIQEFNEGSIPQMTAKTSCARHTCH